MPQPLLGNQVLQDTFEKLGDQANDVVTGLKDLVTGGNDKSGGDNGIEQVLGQNDPNQNQKPQQAGLNPQQLAQKRIEEQEAVKFHREQVDKWGEDYKRMKEEDDAENRKKEEEEKKQEEQKIIQLREEEARAAVLNPMKKQAAKGPGSAFAARSTKSQTEFSKTPSN